MQSDFTLHARLTSELEVEPKFLHTLVLHFPSCRDYVMPWSWQAGIALKLSFIVYLGTACNGVLKIWRHWLQKWLLAALAYIKLLEGERAFWDARWENDGSLELKSKNGSCMTGHTGPKLTWHTAYRNRWAEIFFSEKFEWSLVSACTAWRTVCSLPTSRGCRDG